jgi:hypothetical protein
MSIRERSANSLRNFGGSAESAEALGVCDGTAPKFPGINNSSKSLGNGEAANAFLSRLTQIRHGIINRFSFISLFAIVFSVRVHRHSLMVEMIPDQVPNEPPSPDAWSAAHFSR